MRVHMEAMKGMLLVWLLAMLWGVTASTDCSAAPTAVTVPAAQDLPGVDTGVDVTAGQPLSITATGLALYGGWNDGCAPTGSPATDPNGVRYLNGGTCFPKIGGGAVLPTAPIGALLGRIGSGSWFLVGTSYSGTPTVSGPLFLIYNDVPGAYGNNSGSYTATINKALPDLIGTKLYYRVTTDETNEPNGPLPVNSWFDIRAIVQNQGKGDAGRFKASFYLSKDAVIDPSTDLLITSQIVPSLLAESGYQFELLARLPGDLPITYYGRVWLGMVVDVNNEVRESSEDNNRNQGDLEDRISVQLYDPVLENEFRVPAVFPTEAAGQVWLFRNNFQPEMPWDVGYSRDLMTPVFSRFNGKVMPADAFRMQAALFESRRAGGWAINIQGAEPSFNPALAPESSLFGEPNPRAALKYQIAYPGWYRYVRDYHGRF